MDQRPRRYRRLVLLDVAPEQHEEPDEPVEREPRKPSTCKGRHLRLVDLEHLRGGSLGQTSLRDEGADLPREFRLGGCARNR